MKAREAARVTASVAAGAGLEYLFDPERGRGRRARLRDQLRAAGRRDVREVQRRARYQAGRLRGAVHGRGGDHHRRPADDHVVLDRVRSEVLGRMPELAHQVTTDVVGGVLTLRGELRTQQDIARVVGATAGVPGVVDVVCLLHVPGQAAPNKASAISATTTPA